MKEEGIEVGRNAEVGGRNEGVKKGMNAWRRECMKEEGIGVVGNADVRGWRKA